MFVCDPTIPCTGVFLHAYILTPLMKCVKKKHRNQNKKPDNMLIDATYSKLLKCIWSFFFTTGMLDAPHMCVCLHMCVCVLWDVIQWGAVLLRARPCVHACSAHTFTIWGPEGLTGPGQAMLMDHLAHIAFSFMAVLCSPLYTSLSWKTLQ